MEKAMVYKKSKDFLNNYNLSKDYESCYELSYIMYKEYKDNMLEVIACAENKNKDCIYFDPLLDYADIKESYLIIDDIFESMEFGNELLYMSCSLHFECWNVINNDYPNLNYEKGVAKYLDYCKEHSITKDVLNAMNKSTIRECVKPIHTRGIQGKTQLNKNTTIIKEQEINSITYILLENKINGKLSYSYGLKREKFSIPCYKILNNSNNLIDIYVKYYEAIANAYEVFGRYVLKSNNSTIDVDLCEPISNDKNILNHIVAVKPCALSDYDVNILNQIYVVTECLSLKHEEFGRICKYDCMNLYTGFTDRFYEDELLGTVESTSIPAFMKNNYRKYIGRQKKSLEI